MEVFWKEREDIFCPCQAVVHDVPGEVVQGRYQLQKMKSTEDSTGLKIMTYSTGGACSSQGRHSFCSETDTARALDIQALPDSLNR